MMARDMIVDASIMPPSIRIYQHARIEDGVGVERLLGSAEGLGEQVGTLSVVPGAVKPADGVVVGYRSARLYDGVGGGLLYRRLLCGVVAPPVRARVCIVRRWAVGIDMGEAAVE